MFAGCKIISLIVKNKKLRDIFSNKVDNDKIDDSSNDQKLLISEIANKKRAFNGDGLNTLIILSAKLIELDSNDVIFIEEDNNSTNFIVLEDLTDLFEIYNRGNLLEIPAFKENVIGFDFLNRYTSDNVRFLVEYQKQGVLNETIQKIYKKEEKIKIVV